ncbi:MAG: DUF533 domain-containing protein [Pseudomonadota bacterium]
MYDYRMVFVYPLSVPIEDLSELEESALSHLEKSITNSVDDGWEYVSTTTYSKKEESVEPKVERGVKAFVYRRVRKSNVELSGPSAAAAIEPSRDQYTAPANVVPKNEEDPALTGSGYAPEDRRTTLLTMALLNAMRAHSGILPDEVLPRLLQQGEITPKQQRVLSRNLKAKRSAATIAGITPPGMEKDIFQVSLMTFGDQEAEYTEYITELAAYLDLDEAFVRTELAAKYR